MKYNNAVLLKLIHIEHQPYRKNWEDESFVCLEFLGRKMQKHGPAAPNVTYSNKSILKIIQTGTGGTDIGDTGEQK